MMMGRQLCGSRSPRWCQPNQWCRLFFSFFHIQTWRAIWNDGTHINTLLSKTWYKRNCLVFNSSVVFVSVFTYDIPPLLLLLHHRNSREKSILTLRPVFSLDNPSTFTHLSPFSRSLSSFHGLRIERENAAGVRVAGILFDVLYLFIYFFFIFLIPFCVFFFYLFCRWGG